MPLYENHRDTIQTNLRRLESGEKVKPVAIGTLTDAQLITINKYRHKHGLPPITNEVVFIGSHIYKRRILEDNYSIEDVIDQIEYAFHTDSMVINGKMTAIKNLMKRADRYGNDVSDEAVLECSRRYPRAELFSVVPRGDKNKPPKTKEAAKVSGGSLRET